MRLTLTMRFQQYFPQLFFFLCLAILVLGVGAPLACLGWESIHSPQGQVVYWDNFAQWAASPALLSGLWHTLSMGAAVTLTVTCAALCIAFALTHTRMKGKTIVQSVCLAPLFIPSLMPALGLIYLFGKQGFITKTIGSVPLYGPLGIFLGSCIYTLPHATILLVATLRDIDSNLYLAARTLNASAWRRFVTITLPCARYGLTSAAIVVFILTITDFGIPKVLGGNYTMLATEIYVQAIGLHNMPMAAVVSLVLMLPAVLAFIVNHWAKNRQGTIKNYGAAFIPVHKVRDRSFLAVSVLIASLPVFVLGCVLGGAFFEFWPYNLRLSLINFGFDETVYGISPLMNSVVLASLVALVGTCVIGGGAYVVERCKGAMFGKYVYNFFAILPLCIPGTVLGLSFILAFGSGGGALATLFKPLLSGYGLLLFNCLIHFYTVAHFTAVGGISRLNPQYAIAGQTLGVSSLTTFFCVTVPLQRQTLCDVAFYLFINTLTTISAVVFLYTPATLPASVSILHMMDSGQIAESAAMGCLIFAIALLAKCLHGFMLNHSTHQ